MNICAITHPLKWNSSRTTFGGTVTTQKAQTDLLSGFELREALEKDVDPYIGTLPKELGLNEQEQKTFIKVLDLLGRTLSEFDLDLFTGGRPYCPILPLNHPSWEFKLPPLKIETTLGPIQINFLGTGTNGVGYRLCFRDQSYAFKIFYDKDQNTFRKGPNAEAAIGVFTLAKSVTKDLAQFHMANPQVRWQLSEFIDSSKDINQRSGKTLSEAGFSFSDDHIDANRIRGIRLDYGTIRYHNLTRKVSPLPLPHTTLKEIMDHCPPIVQKIKKYDEYVSLVTHAPTLRKYAYVYYLHQASKEDRIRAFKWSLQFPEIRALAHIVLVPSEHYIEAIDAMSHYPELRTKIPFQLGFLKGKDRECVVEKIKTMDECLAWRIYHGEKDLLPKFFKQRCPELTVSIQSK